MIREVMLNALAKILGALLLGALVGACDLKVEETPAQRSTEVELSFKTKLGAAVIEQQFLKPIEARLAKDPQVIRVQTSATEDGLKVSVDLSTAQTFATLATTFGNQLRDDLSAMAASDGHQVAKQSVRSTQSTGSKTFRSDMGIGATNDGTRTSVSTSSGTATR